MGRKLEVKEGQRFGMLTVIKEVEGVIYADRRQKRRRFEFKCDCGNTTIRGIGSVKRNDRSNPSCGCTRITPQFLESSLTHGERRHERTTVEYTTWCNMKARCYNPNRHDYYLYGGRGITVCDRWRNSYQNFLEDMGRRPEGYSIERRNKDGNYEPDNCKWADDTEQANNRRPWGTAKNPKQTQLIFD